MSGTCIECSHWNLRDSDLRAIDFGKCKVDPERNQAIRAGRHLSPRNVCRFNLFKPAAAATVARREKELAR